jgi:putative ABC transport system permease protein
VVPMTRPSTLRTENTQSLAGRITESLSRTLIQAGVRLWRSPAFTSFALLSFALSVGIAAVLYSAIFSVVWPPSGIPDPSGVAVLVDAGAHGTEIAWRGALSLDDFEQARTSSPDLSDLSAARTAAKSVELPDGLTALQIEAVTGGYFSALGIRAQVGRVLVPSDDVPNSMPAAVLSAKAWRTHFAADLGVVGRSLRIGQSTFEVVGVADDGFEGLRTRFAPRVEAWIPLGKAGNDASRSAPVTVVRHLSAGQSIAGLSSQVAAIGNQLDVINGRRRESSEGTVVAVPRQWQAVTLSQATGGAAAALAPLGVIGVVLVTLVLAVACTNLSNLVLARIHIRRHDTAVRRALGATRGRLVADDMAEGFCLAVVGTLGATVVGRILLSQLASVVVPIAPGKLVALEPTLNTPLLAFAAMTTCVCLLATNAWPALRHSEIDDRESLTTGRSAVGNLNFRQRSRLIGYQVAVSAALLMAAGVCVRVVAASMRHDSGVDVPRLVLGTMDFRQDAWPENRARATVAVLAAAQVPGLDSIAISSGLPFGALATPIASVIARQDGTATPRISVYTPLLAATPSIFKTLGVHITRGRAFDDRDGAASQPVVVVSEHTAVQAFGSIDVVGRQLIMKNYLNMADRRSSWVLTVIGVASNTDSELLYRRRSGVIYVPLAQHYEPSLTLVGRTTARAPAGPAVLRSLAGRVDPDLPLTDVGSGPDLLTGAYVMLRIVSWLAGGLAAVAAGLAMLGLYGLLSALVHDRTRELGVRVALGADQRSIRWLILREGGTPVVRGLAIGLLVSLLARTMIRAAFDAPFSRADLAICAVTLVAYLPVTVLACAVPSRRAVRVDPNEALRNL